MYDPARVTHRLSTKDLVYSDIKRKIVEGRLKPGQGINEKELAEESEVSRTPVREAVQKLELEELIVRLPNGRLKVAPLSVKEAQEVFKVRELLEGLVAREAAMRATDEDIEVLTQMAEQFVRVSGPRNSPSDEVVLHGNQFHSYVGEISQNRTAMKMLQQLGGHMYRYRRLGPSMDGERSRQAAEEHEELFRAIAERDPERAEAVMREHINNSLKAAIQSIERHFVDGAESNESL